MISKNLNEWKKGNKIFNEINKSFKKNGSIQNYINDLKDLRKKIILKNNECSCIDERIKDGKLRLAGSGILFGEGNDKKIDQTKKIKKLAKFLKGKVNVITSHDRCGAAGIFCKKYNLDNSVSDEIGKKFAKSLAEELSAITGKQIKHKHISYEQMINSPNHIARVVYIVSKDIGYFVPIEIKGLPIGFVISEISDKDYFWSNVDLASEIAFNHGFNDLFDHDHPFLLFAVGKNNSDALRLKKDLEKFWRKSKLKKEFNGKIRLESFFLP